MSQPPHRRPPDLGRAVDEDWQQLTLLGSYEHGLAYAQRRLAELREDLDRGKWVTAELRQLEAAWYDVWHEDLYDLASRWSPLKPSVARAYRDLLDATKAPRSQPDLAAELTTHIRRILDMHDRGAGDLVATHDRIWREMPLLPRTHHLAGLITAMREALVHECRKPIDADILVLVRTLAEPLPVPGPAVVPDTAPPPAVSHPDRVPARRRLQVPLD